MNGLVWGIRVMNFDEDVVEKRPTPRLLFGTSRALLHAAWLKINQSGFLWSQELTCLAVELVSDFHDESAVALTGPTLALEISILIVEQGYLEELYELVKSGRSDPMLSKVGKLISNALSLGSYGVPSIAK